MCTALTKAGNNNISKHLENRQKAKHKPSVKFLINTNLLIV